MRKRAIWQRCRFDVLRDHSAKSCAAATCMDAAYLRDDVTARSRQRRVPDDDEAAVATPGRRGGRRQGARRRPDPDLARLAGRRGEERGGRRPRREGASAAEAIPAVSEAGAGAEPGRVEPFQARKENCGRGRGRKGARAHGGAVGPPEPQGGPHRCTAPGQGCGVFGSGAGTSRAFAGLGSAQTKHLCVCVRPNGPMAPTLTAAPPPPPVATPWQRRIGGVAAGCRGWQVRPYAPPTAEGWATVRTVRTGQTTSLTPRTHVSLPDAPNGERRARTCLPGEATALAISQSVSIRMTPMSSLVCPGLSGHKVLLEPSRLTTHRGSLSFAPSLVSSTCRP